MDIERIEAESGGKLRLAVRDLQTGETLRYHADVGVKTASIIKVPMLIHVAMAVAEGTLDWNEKLTLTEAEKVGGSGVLTPLTAGLEMTLRDICILMTVVSDNTATNMVIERLGVEPVNKRLRALGFPVTTLHRKAFSPDVPGSPSETYGLGVTTADESLELITKIAQGELHSQAVCEEMMGILAKQQYRDGIPRFLPSEWRYAGKTGAVDGVRNDVGIVTAPDGRRFALALFCQELTDLRWTPENEGLIALARLARHLLPVL